MNILTSFSSLFRHQQPLAITARPHSTATEDTREPGENSFFCKLPPDMIREIFEFLSDEDVRSALMVSKEVNLSVNYALDGRIRMRIYSIFSASGLFSVQPNTPLRQLKTQARKCHQVMRLRAETHALSQSADARAREKDIERRGKLSYEDHLLIATGISLFTAPLITLPVAVVTFVPRDQLNPTLFPPRTDF